MANGTIITANEPWWIRMWRPAIAWQYWFVCLMDFIGFPILTALYFYYIGATYVAWDPITLKMGGLYHISMAAIVGVTSWTRGQAHIARINNNIISKKDVIAQQEFVEENQKEGEK